VSEFPDAPTHPLPLPLRKVEVEGSEAPVGYVCMVEPEFDAEAAFAKAAGVLKAKAGVAGVLKPLLLKEVRG
jgi:hypothetical protein